MDVPPSRIKRHPTAHVLVHSPFELNFLPCTTHSLEIRLAPHKATVSMHLEWTSLVRVIHKNVGCDDGILVAAGVCLRVLSA